MDVTCIRCFDTGSYLGHDLDGCVVEYTCDCSGNLPGLPDGTMVIDGELYNEDGTPWKE